MKAEMEKLGLLQTVSMSIGGMLGGIFPVLSLAIESTGRKACLSFAVAGVVALITAVSYSRLSCGLDASGAKVVNLLAGTPIGGTLNWSLLLGYVLTTALYAAAFGEFAVKLLGGDSSKWIAVAALLGFGALNLRGVQVSGRVQTWLVQAMFVLLLCVGIGAEWLGLASGVSFDNGALASAHPTDMAMVLSTAGLVLVAYEGFELLSYSFEEIAAGAQTLPKATWVSVGSTTLLYMLLAHGAGRVVPAPGKAWVLVEMGRLCFGAVGGLLVIAAALMATASAINATLFATSRLAKRVSQHRQLPPLFRRWRIGEMSVAFLLLMICATVLLQFIFPLKQMVSFASFVFLIIFAVFNFLGAGYRRDPYWTVMPLLGACGCLVALGYFGRDLYLHAPRSFQLVAAMAAVLVGIRLLHLKYKRLPEH